MNDKRKNNTMYHLVSYIDCSASKSVFKNMLWYGSLVRWFEHMSEKGVKVKILSWVPITKRHFQNLSEYVDRED